MGVIRAGTSTSDMAKPQYTVGFHFVVSTPAQTRDKHARKAIRSHATRAGRARRPAVQLRSWISPARELGSLSQAVFEEAPAPESVSPVSSPTQFGSAFSGLQLPPGVEPYMIQDLGKLIDLDKHGIYPYEICFDVHPVQRGWFPYMMSDVCCIHSMMFSLGAFKDGPLNCQLSRSACLHYAKTLQILQARLNDFDQTSATAATSDSTIMVVFILASAAELMQDFATLANHIKGLEKIVNLRGGVRALNTHNNLQVKVCRADLSYALLSGHRPRLFREGTSWDCFIADRGLIQCSHQSQDANLRAFLEEILDTRMHNALKDLHAFSCISNLAYQTTRKLSPEIYNEIMISILYRLIHLSFESDPVQEAIRLGLLAVSSTIFMQRHFMENPYDRLVNLYRNTLFKLRESSAEIDIPAPLVLWLTMLLHVLAPKEETFAADWLSVWLDDTILRAHTDSWHKAREMLRSIVWVDFVHDRLGKPAFEAAVLRQERSSNGF